MDEKNFPTWMFAAVAVGLGQLTYWLWTRFGFGVPAKASLAATGVAATVFLAIYVQRLLKRKKSTKI